MTLWISEISSRASVPGMVRKFKVACTDPGITLPRKPAFISTGAMVLRIIACKSGLLLISTSASCTSLGSSLFTRLENYLDLGGLLV